MATKQSAVLLLLLITALGFLLRVRALDAVGFNEDEVNKAEAARAYLHGHFSANLEHPMLMKLMVAASVAAADAWNGRSRARHEISEEVAVRLPNVVFGSLTAVVIYLLAQEFFGSGIGLLSALLWAVGIIPITINRVAKEDTALVFFTWLAYYFYLRAKKLGASRTPRQHSLYALSGASFGLMLASKYFPHYLGLNMLYYHLRPSDSQNQPRGRRGTLLVLGMCALALLLANPLLVLPSTLSYIWTYVREQTMTHHGYLMMGQFYYNEPAQISRGMPIYFYLLLLAIKTPLPIVGAFLIGLVEIFRRRREPGPFFLILTFLLWLIPFSLLGSKWLRWMLSLMPTVSIISAIGVAKAFAFVSSLVKERDAFAPRWVLLPALAVVFLVEPFLAALRAAPFYSLYLNPLGMGRVGYYFPHDEINDAGLRGAIQEISRTAPQGAMVGGEAAPVFAYYLHRFGRGDLHYFDLSDQVERVKAPASAYLVVQDGRKYFENIALIQRIESDQTPIQTVKIDGAAAARVYRDEEFAAVASMSPPTHQVRKRR